MARDAVDHLRHAHGGDRLVDRRGGAPSHDGHLGATVEEITWICTGYIIANVVVMPLTAFLGRLFGQKRIYMAASALFLVGSILCGTAHTLGSLLVYRALQGLGAGALQPTEQAILRQTFPPKEQGMAMALFAMAVMLGPAVGPTLGGWIVDNYSWPWIFYINIPVGLLGLVMVATFVHEDEEIRQEPRARRGPAQERRLVGHRPPGRRALLAAVRARGGPAGRLVPVEAHPGHLGGRGRRPRWPSSIRELTARCRP